MAANLVMVSLGLRGFSNGDDLEHCGQNPVLLWTVTVQEGRETGDMLFGYGCELHQSRTLLGREWEIQERAAVRGRAISVTDHNRVWMAGARGRRLRTSTIRSCFRGIIAIAAILVQESFHSLFGIARSASTVPWSFFGCISTMMETVLIGLTALNCCRMRKTASARSSSAAWMSRKAAGTTYRIAK